MSLRLREALDTCSKSFETGDFRELEKSISSFTSLLDFICEPALVDPLNQVLVEEATSVLEEIDSFFCCRNSNEMLLEALSYELPKLVARFAGISHQCTVNAERIINHVVAACNPRDMLAILCEALDSLKDLSKESSHFVPLLNGMSKVFVRVQRHHFKQVKEAIPVILNVIDVVSSDVDHSERDFDKNIFICAINIALSIKEVCEKQVEERESLLALLTMYVLQIMALISRNIDFNKISHCIPLVLKLTPFFPFCGLSFLGLVTGCDVDEATKVLLETDDDQVITTYFPLVKHGASLAVIWGYISEEVGKSMNEVFDTVKNELQSNREKRWLAVGMLGTLLSSNYQPWVLRNHCVQFLLSVLSKDAAQEACEAEEDYSSYMSSIFSSLKAIEATIMYVTSSTMRKEAFTLLKAILRDLPCSHRINAVKELINTTNSPSMVAILIDFVKEEIILEYEHKRFGSINNKSSYVSWISSAYSFVELILKPMKGGPPSFPEDSEAVLASLNLYRYLLIKESSGKSNFSGVLNIQSLKKVHKECLLPLHSLISGIMSENKKDYSDLPIDTLIITLNPVMLVLCRCLELVEDNLKLTGTT